MKSTMNETDGEQSVFCAGHSNLWSKPVHSIIKRTNQSLMVESFYFLPQIHQSSGDLPRRSLQETHKRSKIPKDLNLYPAIAEVDKPVSMATKTCAETQQQSTKSNATTQEKCTKETSNTSSKPECDNTVTESKSLSNLAKNLTLC